MVLDDLLEYDPNSPSGVRWKVKRKAVNPGDIAGSLDRDYWRVAINNVKRPCHHIVCLLHGMEIPEGFIVDHKNGIKTDNRIENLRVVPEELNNRNSKMFKTNTSGHTGVQYKKMGNFYYFAATWRDTNSRLRVRYFNTNKYGEETARQMAIDYRKAMLAELNNRGFGYSNRHGIAED